MTSLLKPHSLRFPLSHMPSLDRAESTPCSSLKTVAGIGLVACSLNSGHRSSRPHEEIDESTGEILTEWLSPSAHSKLTDMPSLLHVT